MKFTKITSLVLSLAATLTVAEPDFCKNPKHTGQSVKITSNKVGSINGIGYELWADSGNNSATFYDDGSFSCSFSNAKDYLCRSGLSFDSTKTHQQLGHMYADFKLVKQNISNVGYSYVGIYGWTRNPLIEFYVVDNWLSPYRPGDWVGNKKYGDFTIDGAVYTVYENTRYNAPSIEGNTTFKQIFSVRKEARDCGTIDITAHFEQWEKLGMKLGRMHEAKILGEAGSIHDGTSGTADFPYAKVYIGKKEEPAQEPGKCSAKILAQGYKCCAEDCTVEFEDEDGTWGYDFDNDVWCGCDPKPNDSCKGAQGYPCCKYTRDVYAIDEDGEWGIEDDEWCLIAN